MIEYPSCDSENCWYRSNFDRLNEYSESKTYIINSCIDRREYDLSDYTCPLEVTLCDVCGEQKTSCMICKREMLDTWIKDRDGNDICRFCIDDLCQWDIIDGYSEELKDLVFESEVKLNEFIEENRDNEELMNLLDDIIRREIREKESEIKEKEIKDQEDKQLRIDSLEELFPSFDQDELNRVDELIKDRKDIKLDNGVFSFIMSILNTVSLD